MSIFAAYNNMPPARFPPPPVTVKPLNKPCAPNAVTVVEVPSPRIVVAEVLRVPEDFSTIKDAVTAADDNDIIEVGPGIYEETIDISWKNLTIISTHGPSATTILGDGTSTTVTALGAHGLFSGFTVTGGGGNLAGGMLLYAANIDIEHCIFAENHTSAKGGGLGIEESVVNFNDVVFLRNTSEDGGALLAAVSMVSFQDCSFIGNTVSNEGGAVFLRGNGDLNPCWATFLGCDFIENEAGERGGAIACPSWYDTEVHRSEVLLWIGKNYNDEIDVSDACNFERNKAFGTVGVGQGGAIYAYGLNLSIGAYSWIVNSTFIENESETGGAIYADDTSPTGNQVLVIYRSRFFDNTAYFTGGAMQLEQGYSYIISHALIESNQADRGGGIMCNYYAQINVINSLIVSNESHTNGAGVSMIEGVIGVTNSILWNNKDASGYGLGAQVSRYNEPLENVGVHSCIQGHSGESWQDTGGNWWDVINTDPRFIDLLGPDGISGTGDENYNLMATSPCIDAGHNAFSILLPNVMNTNAENYDFDWNDRWVDDPYTVDTGEISDPNYWDSVIDIGLYEFVPNQAGVPGDKIWTDGSFDYTLYTDPSNWEPEMPIVGDRAVINTGLGTANVASYVNLSQNQFLLAEGGFWFDLVNNTLNLSTNNGNEIEVGPFFNDHNSANGSWLGFARGTVIAENVRIHGEDYGQLYLSDQDMELKSASVEVEPNGYIIVDGTIGKLTPSSTPVEVQVNGIISIGPEMVIDGSLSLAPTLNESTQIEAGTVAMLIDPDAISSAVISGTSQLDGSLQLYTSLLADADVGDSYVLFESTNGILDNFNCVVSGGFDDDRFLYITIEDVARGSGQQVVAHVESASNLLGFGDPENTALSGNPADAELADMDGDGIVDLVISLPGVDQVVALLNGGNDQTTGEWLGFSSGSISTTVGSTPAGLALGDVEGDSAIDIVVACTDDDEVWVLENQVANSGNFVGTAYAVNGHIPPELLPLKAEPVDVAIGNFVDGGGQDIAVANTGDGTVVILGSTALRSTPFGGGEPINVGMATSVDPIDVNDDKDLDSIAVGGKGDGTVAVVKGSAGLRGYDTIEYYDVGNSPYEVVVGDLNGDGLSDIATADYDDGTISVLVQNVDGTYQGAASFAIGEHPRSISLGDYDVDGDLDIAVVVIETGGSFIRTLRNDSFGGTLVLTIESDYGFGSEPSLVRSADVNGDTSTDIVAISGAVGSFRGAEDPEASGYISDFTAPPIVENDFCADAIPIFEGVTAFSTVDATTDAPAEADSCKFGAPHNDIWYTFEATCNGSLTVSTCGTVDYDTDLALYSGSCETPTLIECNDDGDNCSLYSSLLVAEVNAGVTYLIEVGGWDENQSGSGTLSITLDEPVQQNVIFDQIGSDCDGVPFGSLRSQYHEVDFIALDIAAIETFTLIENHTATRVEAVVNGWGGFEDPSSIHWYEVNFYSGSAAASSSLTGDVHSSFFDPADVSLSDTWQSIGFLLLFDIEASLYAGTQYVSVISRLDSSEGSVGINASGTGTGDGLHYFANPGDGYGEGTWFEWSDDLAYRVIGEQGISCAEDIDGDGIVAVADLLIIIGDWGSCSGCAGDINSDGVVNVEDLLSLIAAWGPC